MSLSKHQLSAALKRKCLRRLCGEIDEVFTTTVQAWIERLPELCQDYESRNILNLDELGLFFKALPEKGLAEKTKKSKGGKKSKQRMTVMFIVASDGSLVFEPTVIWRSKLPRCFKSLKDVSRPMTVHYFSNKKAWMNSDIMESILQRLDRRMNQEKRKVILFWDNVVPETIKNCFKKCGSDVGNNCSKNCLRKFPMKLQLMNI